MPQAIAEALTACGAASAVLPTGVPPAWAATVAAAGIRLHTDEPTLSHQSLNGIDAVVTGAAVAMADSGTIALDHSEDQGRRALSLLPDVHVCVVRADQVVSDVPEGIARLAPALRARRPINLAQRRVSDQRHLLPVVDRAPATNADIDLRIRIEKWQLSQLSHARWPPVDTRQLLCL